MGNLRGLIRLEQYHYIGTAVYLLLVFRIDWPSNCHITQLLALPQFSKNAWMVWFQCS